MNQMHDTDSMLVSEARALQRGVAKRAKEVDALEKQLRARRALRVARRPRRYSLEFPIAPLTEDFNLPIDQNFPAQEQSFVVDGNTTFRCAEVSTSLRAIGSAIVQPFPPVNQIANLTIPYDSGSVGGTNREGFFQFKWRIRDTGSDREWQNVEMPGVFLLSGHLSPLFLPAYATMLGGAEISMSVRPTFVRNFGGAVGLFDTLSSMVLHVSFSGHEVRK